MIPVCDLSRQHKNISDALLQACARVQNRGIFILGAQLEQFEKEFSLYLGIKHAIGVASGTDALSLALLALGIGPGDEVIVPANAYPTVFGVTAIGAIPRLVDIDIATYTISPESLHRTITTKTKAIIPVHLYGQSADMESILNIARREHIAVIEDCAQATGAEICSKQHAASSKDVKQKMLATNYLLPATKVGAIGDLGCFSFYPTKNLGCLGDGGMVVTNNPEIAARVRRLRMYGESSRYNSVELGRNSRLDELQAAFLLVKLKHLDRWNKRRREIARKYDLGIKQQAVSSNAYDSSKKHASHATFCQLPAASEYAHHVYHLYVIRSKQRDQLKRHLKEQGVGTGIHYPTPIHQVSSMKYLRYKKGDFPESERACEEVLSLPMYPELTDVEVQRIADAVNSFNALRHGNQRPQE